MIGIVVRNDDIEAAIRGLKKTLKVDDIHAVVKFRLAYMKPSEKRRAKERKAAIRRGKIGQRKKRLLERRKNVH